jgi:hypothetical protein
MYKLIRLCLVDLFPLANGLESEQPIVTHYLQSHVYACQPWHLPCAGIVVHMHIHTMYYINMYVPICMCPHKYCTIVVP